MKHISLITITFLFSLLAAPASADNTSGYTALGKAAYHKLLHGTTIKGEYRHIRQRTKTYNFTEHHNADGTTDYTEGKIKAKGLWYTVGDDKICYKYPNEKQMGNQTSCFWVYESEGCYYGYSLNAMTLKGPRNYNDWSARWILSGSGNSCAAPLG